jgi:hypothetical protein
VNRRSFLRGLAGGLAAAGLAHPLRARGLAEAARPRLNQALPRRLVIVMQNNGTQQASFWPRGGGFSSPILEPLLANPRLAAQTTLVRGVYVPRDAGGTDGNEHDMGFARMWTGERLLSIAGHPWGGGVSVDQLVARHLGVSSLTLAVYTSAIEQTPRPGFQHRRSFSYVAPGVHRLPTVDPFAVYSSLFGGGVVARQRLALRKSALDVVQQDLAELQARLGPAGRARLDAHAEAVRRVELRLGNLLEGRAGPGQQCARKPAPPRDYRRTAPQLLVSDESAIPDLTRSHIDLITAALACDATRVATLQIGYAGARWKFDFLGIGTDHHLELAHKDRSDEGIDPVVTAGLVKINRWYAEQVATLAGQLDSIPDGSGTLLDSTLLVWANEVGRGDHSQANVPIVLIGGKAGILPPGGRLVDAGPQPFQRVGCTVLRAMGIDVAGFGDAPDCGPLVGV